MKQTINIPQRECICCNCCLRICAHYRMCFVLCKDHISLRTSFLYFCFSQDILEHKSKVKQQLPMRTLEVYFFSGSVDYCKTKSFIIGLSSFRDRYIKGSVYLFGCFFFAFILCSLYQTVSSMNSQLCQKKRVIFLFGCF